MSRKMSYLAPEPIQEDTLSPLENSKGRLRKTSFIAPERSTDRRVSLSLNQFERKFSNFNAGPRKSIFGRRLSYWSRKSSESNHFPRVKLQNTYRIDPKDSEKFKPYMVESKVLEILTNSLKDETYNASNANILSKELSQDIMREIRNMPLTLSPRYKLVSHVLIGESKG